MEIERETEIVMDKPVDLKNLNSLDNIDHVAIQVTNIKEAAAWYQTNFTSKLLYQDETWAFLQFANFKLALVLPGQHPPHLAFTKPNASDYGKLVQHRDATQSVYISDPAGNQVEIMQSG